MATMHLLRNDIYPPFNKGGEMGQMIEAFDWTQNQLGSPDSWPPALKIMLSTVLSCKFPMLLFWGPELIQLYNDAHRDILTRFAKHPEALGQPGPDTWPEIWPRLKPLIDEVLTDGRSALTEDFSFTFESDRGRQKSYWTFSLSAVYNEDGKTAGVLLVCNETTSSHRSRKEMSQLLEDQQTLNEELTATNEELAESNAALISANAGIRAFGNELRESEDKYKTLFQFSPLPMWVSEPDSWKILEVNEMAIKKYGYTRDEFLAMTLLDLRPAEDIPEFLAAQKRIKNYKELRRAGSFRHLKKGGCLMLVEVYGHYFRYQGKTNVLAIANDITDREAALKLLKEKDERLTAATEIARLGYWQVDADRRNRFWSKEVFNIWQVSADADLNDWDYLLSKVHPEDKERFSVKQEAPLGTIRDVDVEYRLLMPDGAVKWVHEIGKVIRDEKGRPLSVRGTVQDITSQKLLALSLQESNERFQHAAQLTSQAIWEWDAAKPEIFKEYGYRELFGHKLCDNTGEVAFWRSKVHPEDYERIWPVMEAARRDPSVHHWTVEYRFKKADGKYLDLKEKALLPRDEQGALVKMIGAMHDITRRKIEERHLKLLESVITNTRDGILVTQAAQLDEPGPVIIYANESLAKMTGYPITELIGKTPRLLQGLKSDKSELERLRRALGEQQPCEINTINYKKNGEEYWVNISVSPVRDEKGTVTHYISVQRDITEKKREEQAFKSFADDLYKRNQELQQFGYLVSHNLRSPVANIMGIADLLDLDKDDRFIVEKCAKDLKLSVKRLDDVIRDLSKILSITDNSVQLVKESVDIGDMITEILDELKDSIKRFGVSITQSAASFRIVSHKAYLYSIFHNLITNAIKYRNADHPQVKIAMGLEDGNVLITISDNGIGIDLSRHSEDLFKPYRRFHSQIEGKGLGLFLVKSHVEALGGKISIASEPGKGTSFTITLPVL